jgi:hypothetical protein
MYKDYILNNPPSKTECILTCRKSFDLILELLDIWEPVDCAKDYTGIMGMYMINITLYN